LKNFIVYCTSLFIVVCGEMKTKWVNYVAGGGSKRNTWRVWLEKLKEEYCSDNIKMDLKLEEWYRNYKAHDREYWQAVRNRTIESNTVKI